jgi:ketosteroid isomerase-like protein
MLASSDPNHAILIVTRLLTAHPEAPTILARWPPLGAPQVRLNLLLLACVMSLMTTPLCLSKMLLLLPVLAFCIGRADAQALESIKSQEELDKAVASLDAALFDSYNRCDLEKFAAFFTDDVEFYHDQGGLTLGKAALTESVKKNICGKVTRELVPGTLQVYPMKGYGAVEMGVHRFHHPGHDDTEAVGEGKFIHLWQYKDGAWKITRVISYDHHAAAK